MWVRGEEGGRKQHSPLGISLTNSDRQPTHSGRGLLHGCLGLLGFFFFFNTNYSCPIPPLNLKIFKVGTFTVSHL